MKIFRVAATLAVGAAAAVAVAALGRSEDIVCGTSHVLDRLADSVSGAMGAGAIDGPTASFCTVPSTSSWLMAGFLFLLAAVLAVRVGSAERPD
jgi:hypothetical protein